MAAQKYCSCGRKIIIRKSGSRRRFALPQDSDHVLCRECYRAEVDRQRARKERAR